MLDRWRDLEALEQAIRDFSAGGGAHKMRIEVEGSHSFVERGLNDTLGPSGFQAILGLACKQLALNLSEARRAFLESASTEHFTFEAGHK